MFKNTNAGGVTVVGTGEAANWEKQRHYTLKEANILIKKIFQRLLQHIKRVGINVKRLIRRVKFQEKQKNNMAFLRQFENNILPLHTLNESQASTWASLLRPAPFESPRMGT